MHFCFKKTPFLEVKTGSKKIHNFFNAYPNTGNIGVAEIDM